MRRTVVYLVSAKIREDSVLIVLVISNEAFHYGVRRSDAFRIAIIEGESHPKNITSDEALVFILSQPDWVLACARVEKICSDHGNFPVIQQVRGIRSTLHAMHHADCHRGLPRPL